ncbi:hypothetical protein [Aquisalinus flavus]|uniref:ATP-grasp domain-containing protein n=1 Tax=Aquisalinus flavus TaxID=1526572 RepID=A0A8J2Y3U2_9PROT|nr:hypothetical protein [Aquisalinus flavus]MBD0426212.1 hypothetical protein [Aquisalinus flavus]UNE48216.1 hypothetical protein FF099_09205 [Aquisalinus flavus]GGD09716.1 hypothetical protein GCM10011342_18260 [Aquisalinus flavus]
MLGDFGFENGQLIVRNTGARISINQGFMKDVASVASFTMEVTAIRAARSARSYVDGLSHPGSLPHARPIRICFTPVAPQVWYAIWPVCRLAGINIVRDPAQADILFYFEDRETAGAMPAVMPGKYMINSRCSDIRKSRVAEVFEQVFGYCLSVDPYTYSGIALMKSERNGVHDGQITPCPYVVPRQGAVFQRLIDNTADGRIYTDIRTPVVGGTLPAIYLKQRTAATRFSNHNFRVRLSSADAELSASEQTLVLEFAARIGLDFGGLDILRDRHDGRIYIVDVNKTDMGPPTALPRAEKLIAMQKLADAFRAWVEPMAGNTIRAA